MRLKVFFSTGMGKCDQIKQSNWLDGWAVYWISNGISILGYWQWMGFCSTLYPSDFN
jgi:hypothetical protein